MALRPVDLQNIINTSVEVAKVTQTRNDTPNMHQGQFAIQLQKEAERKKEQIQKGQGTEKEETKIKDEGRRKNQGKEETPSQGKNRNKTKEVEKRKSFAVAKHNKQHIDIRI